MRNKFIILLSVFLIQTVFAAAQSPVLGRVAAFRSPVSFLPIAGGLFNVFDESKKLIPANRLSNGWGTKCASADDNSLLAPQAIPCNGVTVTSVAFTNTDRTVVSGTDKKVGVVYKYANVGVAPDGTSVDAYVSVVSYSNNEDADQTTFADADLPGSIFGYENNLQPDINQESGVHNGATTWSGSIKYRINFYKSGTTTPKTLTVAATSIDNDGATAAENGCAGALRETVSYASPSLNQILINTFANTKQTIVPATNSVLGPAQNQAGIGIGADYANAALLVNVSQFDWTYSFDAPNNTCAAGTSSARRLGALNLSCQITFDQPFQPAISGNVFNDVNGLQGTPANTIDGAKTNVGKTLYANLIDANNKVYLSTQVADDGTYSFPADVPAGNYTVQLSINQGTAGNDPPTRTLPNGWVNTGENVGAGAGSDGTVDGLLSVKVGGSLVVTNANFGIEQRPTANDGNAAPRNNPGGTTNSPVAAAAFSATDPVTNTVSSIRITTFPADADSMTIGTVKYTAVNFPANGIPVPTNAAGNPTQTIAVDPKDGTRTVKILYVAIDQAGVESASPAMVNVPFTLAPTASNGSISGTLYFGGNPIRHALVVLLDPASNSKTFTRTDAGGNYLFDEKTVGKTYIVQPLSSKYTFDSPTAVINLVENASGFNFNASAKNYHPKNDFDGDGKSDTAVYRPSDGNWYVLKSSDGQMSVFNFGLAGDIPVSGDFDGDGTADYAVFRPSTGFWYIRQSKTQDLRAEQFGLANDRLVPADYDGDGKTDLAVYRSGVWYIRRSSDNSFEAKSYGLDGDAPITGDFDGDGKSDLTLYRPADGVWFTLQSSGETSLARKFGLAADVPLSGDFDGDGIADIAQFRSGIWYVQNSTTDFEASRFGTGEDHLVVGDYDGDGRADEAVFRDGMWSIRNSGDGTVKYVYFGLPTDIPVR